MKKLTRNAKFFIFTTIIILFIIVGIVVVQTLYPEKKEDKTEEKVTYSIALVAEDQVIASTYIDSISTEKSSDSYKDYKVEIAKDTKIGDYTLSTDQSFSKYIKLEGPNGTDILSNKSKQVITHYAYSMLLIGDIQEKTNQTTQEKTYEVINARITYDRIPLVLLSNENSVCLANKAKSKEKIVNLQDFINALNDSSKRGEMISW